MSIKSIIDHYNTISGMELEDSITSPDVQNKTMKIMSELAEATDLAQSTILSRMTEEELVTFILMIQKMSVSAGLALGHSGVLAADMSGDLQDYTQTVVLSVIGALIQDEIL